ncbi:MAG: hypothetical protein M1539_00345 [Actinobacteria bacterium]|nr:hypothetical protein [Actinomycetota bacterium]MCL5882427.1 hypothetical protein [Actinomycetota bacterium]
MMMGQLEQNRSEYRWTRFTSPAALGDYRLAVMERFLADFPEGMKEGRYLDCDLESLSFEPRSFDLALCSHFLFLYSDRLTAGFHQRAIEQMLLVAREVRIFPLQSLAGNRSEHLETICESLAVPGREFEIRTVDYEFKRCANQMLRIR